MSTATKAVQAARFLSGMYRERARVVLGPVRRSLQPSRPAEPHTDPYQIYEEMRAQGPMLPTRLGNYTTTSHRLCNEVLRSRRFGVRPEDGSEDLANQAGLDLSLLELNPPDHTRIRRLAAPAFTPRRMAGYVELVDQAIQGLLDECEREREFDLMTSFASPLPIAVVTYLLGLPNEPAARSTIARALMASGRSARPARWRPPTLSSGPHSPSCSTGAERTRATTWCLRSWLSKARKSPQQSCRHSCGSFSSQASKPRSTRSATACAGCWPTGSSGSCSSKIPSGRRPSSRRCRFDPPVQQTARVARPAEVGNVLVVKNQWVITLLAAANRDPDVYPEPNRFDITRESPVEHLAFSGGIHYCLGSPLARLELTQAFRALAERFPTSGRPRRSRCGPVPRCGPPGSRWRCPSASAQA